MKSLLVLVHGTPRPAANAEMLRVIDDLRAREIFGAVEAAFLECNAPSIPDAIDGLAAHGATEIVAVPYFLHTGTHVCDDLPTLLEEGMARHPGVVFRLGDYLGLSPVLTQILQERSA